MLPEHGLSKTRENSVVDENGRTDLADCLNRLVSGEMTNDEFDDAYYGRWHDSTDAGVAEIAGFGYGLYSSDLLLPYRLKGVYRLSDERREVAERALLFLESRLEYGWPTNDRGVEPYWGLWGPGCYLVLGLLLLFGAAFARSGLDGLILGVVGLLMVPWTFHWLFTRRRRTEEMVRFLRSGDYKCGLFFVEPTLMKRKARAILERKPKPAVIGSLYASTGQKGLGLMGLTEGSSMNLRESGYAVGVAVRSFARHRRRPGSRLPQARLPSCCRRPIDRRFGRSRRADSARRRGRARAGSQIIDAAMGRFGRVDTLVNNAGIFIAKPFHEYTDEDYAAVTGVNLRGFFSVSRSAIAAMLTRDGGGHVVNISTSLVDHANSQVPSVLASLTKGGLNAATKSLAIEYAGRGIRSNAVALGVIRTPMHPPETHEALAGLHPLRPNR